MMDTFLQSEILRYSNKYMIMMLRLCVWGGGGGVKCNNRAYSKRGEDGQGVVRFLN